MVRFASRKDGDELDHALAEHSDTLQDAMAETESIVAGLEARLETIRVDLESGVSADAVLYRHYGRRRIDKG